MSSPEHAFGDPVVAAIHAYIASDAGQQRIAWALQRRRLPSSFDSEIESAVVFEAERYVQRGGQIINPVAWANQRITARSIDLVRGVIRTERRDENVDELLIDDEGGDGSGNDITDAGEVDTAMRISDASIAQLRHALVASDASDVDVSAALTVVSVIADNAPLSKDCPQPVAGATPMDAACWAGLWYAGRSECFGESNTVTQRRARAARRAKMLLTGVVARTARGTP